MFALLRPLALTLVVVLSLAVAGCGGDDDEEGTGGEATTEAAAEAPSFDLKIGAVLPLTGDLASFGPSQAEAARIAVEQITAALEEQGITDVTVELVGVEDDQGRSQAGVEAATKLVQTDDANVLLATMASSVTIPIAQSVAVPNEVVLISPRRRRPRSPISRTTATSTGSSPPTTFREARSSTPSRTGSERTRPSTSAPATTPSAPRSSSSSSRAGRRGAARSALRSRGTPRRPTSIPRRSSSPRATPTAG
jgi:hypothetical protein